MHRYHCSETNQPTTDAFAWQLAADRGEGKRANAIYIYPDKSHILCLPMAHGGCD